MSQKYIFFLTTLSQNSYYCIQSLTWTHEYDHNLLLLNTSCNHVYCVWRSDTRDGKER